jgi:hypothetical protein
MYIGEILSDDRPFSAECPELQERLRSKTSSGNCGVSKQVQSTTEGSLSLYPWLAHSSGVKEWTADDGMAPQRY